MDFGAIYAPTHDGMAPGPLAALLEEHGHESLFFGEHSHIPANSKSRVRTGGETPVRYWHTHDLFVSLAAAAAATTGLRVGTAVCLVAQRDPIMTAKAVASIDHISGGRLEFGVGAGWNLEEAANHGTDPRLLMQIFRERIEAMKAIWTQAEASYSGDHVAFEGILSYPKPVQFPYPRVLIGGAGEKVLDRVLAYGDGWIPFASAPKLFERIDELRARADRAIDVQVMGVPADPKVLERLRRAGVRRAVHELPSGMLSTVEPALARWEGTIAELNGS